MATSPSSASTTSSSSSSSFSSSSLSSPLLHTFSTPLTLKFNDENFLVWRQQILAQVEGLDLLHFLTSSSTPPKHLTPGSGFVNPAYLMHKQQDHLLVARLLASMSISMLTQMVGLCIAHLIWDKLTVYYASHTRAKVCKLKLQLKT